MIKKSIILILLVIMLLTFNTFKETNQNNTNSHTWNGTPNTLELEIGTLTINKINLQEKLYHKDSAQNTVEKNLAFLKESDYPDKENGIVLIAGHSGTGSLAYFKDLDKVNVLDEIVLTISQNEYHYKVVQYLVQEKDGTIDFSTNPNQSYLILTTCMPHVPGKQLVLIAEKEEI